MEPHPTNQNVHGGICTLNVDKKLVDRTKVHIYASQMKIFISAPACEYQICNIVIAQKDMKNQRFGRYKKLWIQRVSQDVEDIVFLMISMSFLQKQKSHSGDFSLQGNRRNFYSLTIDSFSLPLLISFRVITLSI